MKQISQISPVLDHLAWWEAHIRERSDHLQFDALHTALLTYNAAVMLQWRAVCSSSYVDIDRYRRGQQAVSAVIGKLLDLSRKVVTDLQDQGSQNAAASLNKLSQGIKEAIAELLPLFRLPEPKAARLTDLERNPDIPQLIREYMAEHGLAATRAAPAAGLSGASEEEGPDAAIHAAIAMLVVSLADDEDDAEANDPGFKRALVRISKGFLKTAVDLKAEEHDSPELHRLKDLADAMLVDTAGTF
jgi:hypothetical protein